MWVVLLVILMPLGRVLQAWLTETLLASTPLAVVSVILMLVLGMLLTLKFRLVMSLLVVVATPTWASIPLRLMFCCGLVPITLISLVTARLLLLTMRVGISLVIVITRLLIIRMWQLPFWQKSLMTIC